MESESDPLTRRPVELFEKEPLKGNSEVHLHTPTRFGEDRSKDLGGDREQTDKQTDKRCSNYNMILFSVHPFIQLHIHRPTPSFAHSISHLSICIIAVEWATHIQMYAGSSPTNIDHRDGLK